MNVIALLVLVVFAMFTIADYRYHLKCSWLKGSRLRNLTCLTAWLLCGLVYLGFFVWLYLRVSPELNWWKTLVLIGGESTLFSIIHRQWYLDNVIHHIYEPVRWRLAKRLHPYIWVN